LNVNPLSNPTAQAVDNVLIYIFGFSLILLLGITAVAIYFVIRYRRSTNPQPTSQVHGNLWLETLWTLLPTLIVLTMFWYGWVNYVGLREVPDNALQVKATARMWSWQFEYPDGRRENKLYVPVGRPVKVDLISVDVLHNFFAPAFRIKRDAVPGMETYLWFTATEAGSYDVFCAEYCGLGHSAMITTIEALDQADYAAWAQPAETPQPTAEPHGLTILKEQGCTGCHSLDGSPLVGPSFKGLAGRTTRLDRDGTIEEVEADADYIRRSLLQPKADIVEGYPPIMPAADDLSAEEIEAIVDYLLQPADE
jgi:cytochrome c oxidase subunit 2